MRNIIITEDQFDRFKKGMKCPNIVKFNYVVTIRNNHGGRPVCVSDDFYNRVQKHISNKFNEDYLRDESLEREILKYYHETYHMHPDNVTINFITGNEIPVISITYNPNKTQSNSIISEEGNISNEVNIWSRIIYKDVMNNPSLNIIIHGKDYPEGYNVFPIDLLYITKTREEIWYDDRKSGYNENGEYCVYIKITNNNTGISYLNHELRHAFEDYMRMSKGHERLTNSKEGHLLLSNQFEDFVTGKIRGDFWPFKNIMWALYYTTKIEESAYGETVYGGKSNGVIKKIKDVVNFNYSNLIRDFSEDCEESWINMKNNVNIPILDKFNDYESFIKWAENRIKYRGRKVLNKLNKIKYKSMMDKQIKRGV